MNFIDHTDQAKNAIHYIETIIPRIIETISNQLIFRYLDVGCGYGYQTLSIMHAIKQYRLVHVTALDPSSELLCIFRKHLKNENINLLCANWENYQPTENFHFISSMHTFYYIKDWQSAIHKMMNNLDRQGTLCLVIRTNDPVCQFKDHFFKKINGAFKKERNFNELCDVVEKMGIKYQTHVITSKLDIKDCLLGNNKGKQLIEFLLRMPYKDLLDNIKDEIQQYLEENNSEGYLVQKDGFLLISPAR